MLVKIMGAEDAPDDDSRKTFRVLADVIDVEFIRVTAPDYPYPAQVRLLFGRPGTPGETFDVPGNVYVMNDNGKTVASFGSSEIPKDGGYGDFHPVARDHSAELAGDRR